MSFPIIDSLPDWAAFKPCLFHLEAASLMWSPGWMGTCAKLNFESARIHFWNCWYIPYYVTKETLVLVEGIGHVWNTEPPKGPLPPLDSAPAPFASTWKGQGRWQALALTGFPWSQRSSGVLRHCRKEPGTQLHYTQDFNCSCSVD